MVTFDKKPVLVINKCIAEKVGHTNILSFILYNTDLLYFAE